MHFEKITREQWVKDVINSYQLEYLTEGHFEKINKLYDGIKLPKRATKYSAGYDFYVSGDVAILSKNSLMTFITFYNQRGNVNNAF